VRQEERGVVVAHSMTSAQSLYLATDSQTPRNTLRAELRELVRLSVPIAGAQLALMSMGLVDMAILGRAGKVELAGAGIGRNIGFLAQTVAMGVAMALEPLASQALGAGKPAEARAALTSTLRALAWLWPFSVLGAVVLSLSLGPLGVDPIAIPIARRFLIAMSPSFFFYTVFLACKTYLQAHGKTRPVVTAALVANVVNYFACTILVHAYGALGSGMAMSISAAFLAGITMFASLRVGAAGDAPVPSPMHIVRLGLPIALTLLAEIGVFVLASVLAGRLGPAVMSAHQVALSLASFTFMGALGVSGATAVRVGRAVGEGTSPRSRGLLGIGLGALVMSASIPAFACWGRGLVRIFSPELDVIEVGAALLQIAAVFQLFDGVQCVAGGALRGAGDLKFAFAGAAIGYWLVGFPVALLLGFGLNMGASGLWWGLTLGLVTVAIVLSARFWLLTAKPIATMR